MDKARKATRDIRDRISALGLTLPEAVTVVTNGSLARGEVTSQSDLDAYVIVSRAEDDEAAKEALVMIAEASGLKAASEGGAFGKAHLQSSFLENIGGQKDDNAKFTRRMLFLLESVPLLGADYYEQTVDRIILRYVSDDITPHQLGRFLLNDIIRFYRTMCVDFEFKTNEQRKSWGVRNIKLVFSRKLMYFSGVIMCAQLAERSPENKRAILRDLVLTNPIDRLIGVMGSEIMPALRHYDTFLASLDDASIRAGLENVELTRNTHTKEFRFLKDTGHHFSWALVNALRKTYPPSHPIHDALVV